MALVVWYDRGKAMVVLVVLLLMLVVVIVVIVVVVVLILVEIGTLTTKIGSIVMKTIVIEILLTFIGKFYVSIKNRSRW